MGKKIIITGGLGYIGTELCKIYSGYSWNDEIIVIDNRFVSERVKQLRDWGFDFRQGDILDKEFMCDVLKDADIVYHFAGISSLPECEANPSKAFDINCTGLIRLLESAKKKNIKKIFFSFTSAVYENSKKKFHHNSGR